DTESGGGDEEVTESDREDKEEETRQEEEESFDPIPRIPKESKDDGNDEEDQGLRLSDDERIHEEEEAEDLYRDVDINQGRGLQVSQNIEDSHVTLTPVHPDGLQESSSVSSFVTSMLNPISDTGVESIFTTASSSIVSLQTPTPIMTPSTIATITTSRDAPIPPTPIPSDQMTEAVREAVQIQTDRLQDSFQRENDEFLRTIDENMKKIIKGQVKSQVKEQVSRILPRIEESVNATLEAEVLTSDDVKMMMIRKDPSLDQTGGPRDISILNGFPSQGDHQHRIPLPLIPDNQGRRVIPFSHFINNDLEYLRGGTSSQNYTTFVTKTKAADYGHIKWIEDLVPRTMWIQEPLNYDKYALWGVSHWGWKRKLSNLTVEERFAFNVSLRMFTRSIVIQRRMEDLQLGVESYQKRLNLTKPDTYRSDLKRREVYTAYSNPRGFIYQNKDKKNRLMRIDELHKFSDGTLNDVRNTLDDRLKGIRMLYLPHTIWRRGDKDRAAAMIQAIDKMLKTRRIMRSLEKFVGGRLYEGDFCML
nr:hypothetical protein [Tanacetum cinerariifolium]